MKITRRDALRGLLGGAAAVAAEPVRRIWQVGAQLERPTLAQIKAATEGVDYEGDGNFAGGMGYDPATGAFGKPFSDDHLHPYQRAALAAETGRWEGPPKPSQECRRAWEHRYKDRIISDEAHRLPARDPMEIGRRIHEQVELGMKWDGLETMPGFRHLETGEVIPYGEACKRGIVEAKMIFYDEMEICIKDANYEINVAPPGGSSLYAQLKGRTKHVEVAIGTDYSPGEGFTSRLIKPPETRWPHRLFTPNPASKRRG